MGTPLVVDAKLTLPAGDLSWTATRSSGPGGQNVNKVASRVELRFDLAGSLALDDATKARLRALAPGALDAEGRLLIKSEVTRDQHRNLADAKEKLRQLVVAALIPPKRRRKTKPTKGSKMRRLSDKRHNSEKKQGRSTSE